MNTEMFTGNSKKTTDILGQTWEYECMGCQITDGTITPPGGVIYDGKSAVLAADPEVPIPGFLIVNFRRHIRSFSETTEEERKEISDVIYLAEKSLRDLGICEEVTLVQEERSKHFHIWIFPNYSWMTEKFGKGVTYLRDIMEYARNNSNEDVIQEVLNVIEKVREYIKSKT